jgi:hypothetical protein
LTKEDALALPAAVRSFNGRLLRSAVRNSLSATHSSCRCLPLWPTIARPVTGLHIGCNCWNGATQTLWLRYVQVTRIFTAPTSQNAVLDSFRVNYSLTKLESKGINLYLCEAVSANVVPSPA